MTDIDWDAPPPRGYRRNTRGDLVREENIRQAARDADEVVRRIHSFGADLSEQIGRFRAHCAADIAGHVLRVAEEYGSKKPGGIKGNVALSTIDGRLRVVLAQAEFISVGPPILAAQALVEELIDEWAPGSNKNIRALIDQSFRRDATGQVSVYRLLRLRSIELPDPRWREVQRAIGDALQPSGRAEYIRLHRRATPAAPWEQVPLGIATARAPDGEPADPGARLERRLRSAIEEAKRGGMSMGDVDERFRAAKRAPEAGP